LHDVLAEHSMTYVLLVVRQYFFAFAVLGLSITAFFAAFLTFVFLLAGQVPKLAMAWSLLPESEGGRLAVLAMLHFMTMGKFRSLIWPRFMDNSAVATFIIAGLSGALAHVGLQVAMGMGGNSPEFLAIIFLAATGFGALADRFVYHLGGSGGAPLSGGLWMGRLICGRANYVRFVEFERQRMHAEFEGLRKQK
jgi:hypothetical protein